MHIAIVDDSKSVHAFLKELFSGLNVSLEHFYDGQDIVDHAPALSKETEIILLDWEMQVLNGIDALPRLRALRPEIKVVMMTSKNAMSDIVLAMELGAQDYVMKPFTREILIGKLELNTGKKVA